VAQALGIARMVFTTGGKSEAAMQALLPALPEEAFVQMGDYVRFALRIASNLRFREITVGAFFGKAVKIAQGKGHTHASRGLPNLAALGGLTLETTGKAELARMLASLRSHAGDGPELAAAILDFSGSPLWQGRSPRAAGTWRT